MDYSLHTPSPISKGGTSLAFSPDVAESLLVACHRHCCLCHKFCGTHIEIHHIHQDADGGPDDKDNGIPLCFDCHAQVNSYNDRHPRGRKYQPSELKKHRENWFTLCKASPWAARPISGYICSDSTDELRQVEQVPATSATVGTDRNAAERFVELITSTVRIEVPTTVQEIVGAIILGPRASRPAFVSAVTTCLRSEDEETRWKAARIMEDLVLWAPELADAAAVEHMANDEFWAVRSSAALCYYHLAALNPAAIPIDLLYRLASHFEDWYVFTPAIGALLRLARSRPIVIDLFVRGLKSNDKQTREYAAVALQRLAQTDWDLVSEELISLMKKHEDPFVRQAGEKCISSKKANRGKPQRDYAVFSPFYIGEDNVLEEQMPLSEGGN